MNINKSSWHYQVAFFMVNRHFSQMTICEYVKYFLRGVFVICLWIVVGSLLTYVLVIAPMLAAIVSIIHQTFGWVADGAPPAMFGITIWCIAIVTIMLCSLPYLARRVVMAFATNKLPTESVLALWLRSVKEKTCFNITFVDNKTQTK